MLNVLAQCRLGNQVVTFADRLAEKTSANQASTRRCRPALRGRSWYMGHVEEIIRRAELVRQDEVSPSIRAEISNAFRALALSSGSDYSVQRTRRVRRPSIERAARSAFRLRKLRRYVHSPRHR